MPCANQCRSPFGMLGKPCAWCAAEYERLMDDEYDQVMLRNAHKAFERWVVPATDQERTVAWLDQVAPVINQIQPNFTFAYWF